PQVLHGARTFWEKVTAVHAFITRNNAAERFRGGEHEARSESRHWYDVNALHQHHRLGGEVIERVDLRDLVILAKQRQFRIVGVDYEACGRGGVCLVPRGELRAAVLADYEIMRARGMFRESHPPPSFDDLMTRMQEIEDVLNALPHTQA
ncbi:MAG: nucleotidyl transferase AbiEii/AbiGii toxin family protein, partial [Trueperaceae bacterium]|nr:nucleotidyl transferase AbiEii/AbiGii toxin family protein [Trueperaceae bacterium]